MLENKKPVTNLHFYITNFSCVYYSSYCSFHLFYIIFIFHRSFICVPLWLYHFNFFLFAFVFSVPFSCDNVRFHFRRILLYSGGLGGDRKSGKPQEQRGVWVFVMEQEDFKVESYTMPPPLDITTLTSSSPPHRFMQSTHILAQQTQMYYNKRYDGGK